LDDGENGSGNSKCGGTAQTPPGNGRWTVPSGARVWGGGKLGEQTSLESRSTRFWPQNAHVETYWGGEGRGHEGEWSGERIRQAGTKKWGFVGEAKRTKKKAQATLARQSSEKCCRLK